MFSSKNSTKNYDFDKIILAGYCMHVDLGIKPSISIDTQIWIQF